jgi:hypothetical protein
MRGFTIYIDRDMPVECENDRSAVELARRVHERVDELLAELAPDATCSYARSTCHRGTANKMIFDEERYDERADCAD